MQTGVMKYGGANGADRVMKEIVPNNAIRSPVLPNYVGVVRSEARAERETKIKQETRRSRPETGFKQRSNQQGARRPRAAIHMRASRQLNNLD